MLCYSILLFLVPLANCVSFGDSHDQTALDTSEEATYLKLIFPGGETQYFRNWECPDGVWAEDMHLTQKPTCVCVKGVYAIGSNLCDEDFKILTGIDHCFDISGQTIRKFIPLTGKSGFAGRANTVFRKEAPYFARLTSSTPTTTVPEPMDYVFRMNDPNDFSIYAKLSDGKAARLKCLYGQNVQPNPALNPVMQIARLPNCSNEFRGPKTWCESAEFNQAYQWSLSPGQGWAQMTGEIIRGSKGMCGGGSTGKKPAKTAGRRKRAVKPPRRGSSSPAQSLQPVKVDEMAKCNKFDEANIEPEEYDTSSDHFYQLEVMEADKVFHSTGHHQRLVNEQNKRIFHQIRRYHLDIEKGFAEAPRFVNFPEYKYIQLAKEILIAVCPKERIPKSMLDFLMRAFRFLYIDSSKNFPYPIKSNEHEHKRIIEALTQCKAAAASDPIYFDVNKTCPAVPMRGTNQTGKVYLFGTNITYSGEMSYNLSSMDVAIELVWKLTLLTHYYCADKFATGFDHSLAYVKMEAMLKNPTILFRWYFPGQFNRMMQYFLMTNNFEEFADSIDRCVLTAYAGSNYTEWLTRPADLSGWTAQLKKLPHEVGTTVRSAIGNAGKAGRRKRYYFQDDIWQKKAYCMHSTDAPYNEVRTTTFLSCKRRPLWFDNTD